MRKRQRAAAGRILRPCTLCGKFHASYLVEDPQLGTAYLCYSCWKARQAPPGADSAQPVPPRRPRRPQKPARLGVAMRIRKGTLADAAMLAELAAQTFSETFAKDNTPENLAIHLASSYSPDIQGAELASADTLFLIAEAEAGQPVGFIQLILESRDPGLQGQRCLEIRRLYARQAYLGTGVGRALMEAALREAAQRGFDSLWLGVWEKNPRAIRFYEKWGFQTVGEHVFQVGADSQRDLIMERRLPS